MMDTALYPFALNFDGLCARFPFIFEGEPVASIGGTPAPSCLISSRAAGDMAFRGVHGPVREEFFHSLGILPERVYSLIQVHSHDVFALGRPEGAASASLPEPAALSAPLPSPAAFAREGDGMVSFTPGIVLGVTVADCLPVFLLDTENGYWAVLHSGWKGTGIVVKALETMRQAGTRLQAVAAVLGPCIQSCCYRVDEERAKRFEVEFASNGGSRLLGPLSRRDEVIWYIDLQAANVRLLAAAGVRHIAHCTDCTFTDERLGSFRREGTQSYTRMIAMAYH